MPVFLAEFYDEPVSLDAESRKDKEPKIVYFSDQSEKLYTYKPSAKSVTIEFINDMGPLPEFLHIAGFLHFDIESLKEKAYLNEDVFQEEIDGVSTYKVEITPRKKMKGIEPPRHIWIDRESNMPKQLSVTGDIHVLVTFDKYMINQGIKPEALEPDVPQDVTINDKTR